jgi:ornithine cyclodeaminase/alanine dehydrogenase-like protein (mu-crystallin family)
MISEPMDSAPAADRATRILSRAQVAELLDLDDCIDAVEAAFLAHADGRSIPPGILGVPVEGGGFHLKTAGLKGERPYFATKINGNFFHNAERFGLPRIQGLIVLCDARHGYPLAVLDSIHITTVRTAAASAVAARHLARAGAATVTVVGCGVQGRVQLAAIRRVRPVETAFLVDADPAAARRLAAEIADEMEGVVLPLEDLARGLRRSDLCITCTPSRQPLFGVDAVAPGTFIAAAGADSEEKQELDPELLAASAVVVDHLEQCATIGELHRALDAGVMQRSDVRGELHEVLSGRRPGRLTDDEIVIFDSTGVALQDVAAAALVYERACDAGVGEELPLL